MYCSDTFQKYLLFFNFCLSVTTNSSSLIAATIVWKVVAAILDVQLVPVAHDIIHCKVAWNRTPTRSCVGVSASVSQLATHHLSIITSPIIITDRSKVAVGIACKHVPVGLWRSNRPSSKFNMKVVHMLEDLRPRWIGNSEQDQVNCENLHWELFTSEIYSPKKYSPLKMSTYNIAPSASTGPPHFTM